EVTQAWQKMREARSRIEQARIQRSGAEATEMVAEKAYEVGRGTVLEVQAAQREVRLARERELQAVYDLHVAATDFAAAQGATVPDAALKPAGRAK
ncbi:MAG TPA: TolC family protein, partial [Chthonomonadaceae bacterium]|nr:TolC family protein [Chthonomonadaceae bacterium]